MSTEEESLFAFAQQSVPELQALAARPEGLRVAVVGSSMEPTLMVGQTVVVRVDRRPLRPGQVVMFEARSGRCLVIHRVVFCIPGLPWFVHAGDHSQAKEGIGHGAKVIGIVDSVPVLKPSRRRLIRSVLRVARGLRARLSRAIPRAR